MEWDFSKPAPRLSSLTPAEGQTLVDALWQEVRDAREQASLNSKNSSKPPSTDQKTVRKKKKDKAVRPRKKRRQGGQPGHEGHARKLLPEDQVDEVVVCPPPDRCDCGGRIWTPDKIPHRHQVFELPEIQPHVTEYQLLSGRCAACGQCHEGALPAGVPKGMLGPRMMAWISVLVGCYHLSRRKIQRLLDGWLNLDVSLGTISNSEQKVSEALVDPVEEAKIHVREQASANLDETGHRQSGDRMWLWVAVTNLVSIFLVSASRGAKVAKELLGEGFTGIVTSDRWSAYSWIDTVRRQLCWAHLIRDFIRISERSGQAGQIGDTLLCYARRMFRLLDKIRDGTLDRRFLVSCMKPIQLGIEQTLECGTSCGDSKTEGTCKKILSVKAALWTFVTTPGIEPTNNVAERTLRDYVVWRKMSFGTQSERGNRFVERIMTVSASCKQQGRDAVEFITEAVRCHLQGIPTPSLV